MEEDVRHTLGAWLGLVEEAGIVSSALCVALFQVEPPKMLFGNRAIMQLLKKENPINGLINPDFSVLASLPGEGVIYEGYLTIGDSISVNTTIDVRIYRQGNEMLLTGEINLLHMLDQNNKMARLNQDVNNLQRNLVKEKMLLANILDELQQANEQLALLNKEKNRFISMAAHDLRSPVSTALSYTDIMLNNEGMFPLERNKHFLGIIEERLNYSLKLMSELLDIGKIEAGSLTLHMASNDYVQLLGQVVQFNRLVADMKNIRIELACEEQQIIFNFDREKLEQVLNNLISNAIKYSEPGSNVHITVERQNGKVLTSVIDQGVGIKASELPLIFQPFQKSSSRPTAGESSTGLGLVIAKKIVEEHGGNIEVRSEERKGSCFRFDIPVSHMNSQ